jgi:two-component system LytT family response regulator
LTDLLRRENHITAIHEATDGRLAIEAIADFKPDLVFLDVQMPELDGLHVIESVGAERMPLTVFVTAFDQHAIAAFEANAVDYLLKPFSDERFASTMARYALAWMNVEYESSAKYHADDFARAAACRLIQRLVVKIAGATRFSTWQN